jgi:hypothetical protein
MTEDELIDVVDYLASLKTPSLSMDSWHMIGPFANGVEGDGLEQTFPPEREISLRASYQGKAGPIHWRTVKPDERGYVDLRAALGKRNGSAVSYVYREVESPVDQEATVLIGTDVPTKVWVNKLLVYSNRKQTTAAPEAESATTKLKKGKNTILLKIRGTDSPHGFYFTILAEHELKRLDRK